MKIFSEAIGGEVWIVPKHTRQPRYEVEVGELKQALAAGKGEELVEGLRRVEEIRKTFNGTLLAVLPGDGTRGERRRSIRTRPPGGAAR